jgi:ABC-type branched-subunit amino acid transport system substrate-binding protein
MIYEEKALAVIGSIDSSATHLAEQIVAKANLPLISPIATDKSLTLAGVSWMFSCAPSDAAIATALVDGIFAWLKPGHDSLALVCATDHESRMTSQETLRELVRRQRPPAFRFEIPTDVSDLSKQVSALRKAEPDAILIIAGAADSARLVQHIRTQLAGNPPRLFGGPSMARRQFRELAGPGAEEVCFPLIAAPQFADPQADWFVQRFTKARGHAPDYTAFLTYDATRLLLSAIRQAGPNRARVRSELVRLSPWEGIAGTIGFDGTGQNKRKAVPLATWSGDEFKILSPRAEP